jgi:hypothetical protein
MRKLLPRDGAVIGIDLAEDKQALEHQRPEQVHRRYPVQPMPRVIVGPPVDQPGNDGIGRVQPGTSHLQPGQDAAAEEVIMTPFWPWARWLPPP